MAFQRTFSADTLEEALERAEEFKATLDPWSQPSIWGQHERDGKWFVTVNWYGLD